MTIATGNEVEVKRERTLHNRIACKRRKDKW